MIRYKHHKRNNALYTEAHTHTLTHSETVSNPAIGFTLSQNLKECTLLSCRIEPLFDTGLQNWICWAAKIWYGYLKLCVVLTESTTNSLL